ncbi:winged helix-turn-helix domain-containing protein [Elusimicrobiota bacterium]
MKELVSITSDKVWQFLSTRQSVTLSEIKVELGVSNTLLCLALGWLVKEGKINILESGHTYNISVNA